MDTTNIRDILTCLSPSLDFFAISSGDGRIKIWDTVKGQVQTEFADIVSTETTANGLLNQEKKRKLGTSLLVLGTGSGDVLALDVSAGISNGDLLIAILAVSMPSHSLHMVHSFTRLVLMDWFAKLTSCQGTYCISLKLPLKQYHLYPFPQPDGKILATATSQLKIFNCLDDKKLQKFSGHPGAVRCMVFSEDGRHVLSSADGDRHIAVWKLDGSKKKSACCLLPMDHPAVFLDSYCIKSGVENDASLGVVAISEIGVCYFWHGKSFEELRNLKPTKICASLDEKILKKHKEVVHSIFSAKLQSIGISGSGHMFVAYGLLIKPSFEKVMVQPGTDIRLKSSLDGILLPFSQSRKSKQASNTQRVRDGRKKCYIFSLLKVKNHNDLRQPFFLFHVTALDCANAEGALLPLPKILDQVGVEHGIKPTVSKDVIGKQGEDEVTICMEDQLKSMGIISSDYDLSPSSILDPKILKGISVDASMPPKMKSTVLSLESPDAYNLLNALVAAWQSRSSMGRHVLPWIYCILVNHNEYVTSQEPLTPLLDFLNKLTRSKVAARSSLLQLSGRLQLVMAQIEKADNRKSPALTLEGRMDESEDDEVDEIMYGVDEESQTSSDGDD